MQQTANSCCCMGGGERGRVAAHSRLDPNGLAEDHHLAMWASHACCGQHTHAVSVLWSAAGYCTAALTTSACAMSLPDAAQWVSLISDAGQGCSQPRVTPFCWVVQPSRWLTPVMHPTTYTPHLNSCCALTG